ncbi:MAG: hypothetical protein HZA31_12640 [Opitutae bacterium]|nr:hypothetical protein [Opitutae bacterium]
MSLQLATLLPGLLLLALGGALLSGNSAVRAALTAFPRSRPATYVCFGAACAWFLYHVWHLSPADFAEYKLYLFIGFAAVGALSFWCVPDFLAVRGLAALVLLAASPLLEAAYMDWAHPQRLLMVGFVFLCISLAIWLGASPYRLRDALEWMFRTEGRPRLVGGVLAGYGAVLLVVAFTY